MIQVQIASQITAQGLCGVRWVLVEAVDGPAPEPTAQGAANVALTAAAAAVPAAAPPGPPPVADSLRLGLMKALVVVLGLGAALLTAAVQVGPPAWPGLAPVPGVVRPAPAAQEPSAPVAPTEPAEPAEPAASGGLPRLTAAL